MKEIYYIHGTEKLVEKRPRHLNCTKITPPPSTNASSINSFSDLPMDLQKKLKSK